MGRNFLIKLGSNILFKNWKEFLVWEGLVYLEMGKNFLMKMGNGKGFFN